MKDTKILLVEDSPDVQTAVEIAVSAHFPLIVAPTIASAESKLSTQTFDLMLLDVLLPDGTGFDFCERLRKKEEFQNLPIIFLTGQGDLNDRVRGLSSGADDYVLKPFQGKELVARIQAKLRRSQASNSKTSFTKANFSVDLTTQSAFAVQGDKSKQKLDLTPIEFKLLVHFLNNEGKVVTREELMGAIWGKSVHVSNHTVDTHISSLRKKIGDSGRYLKAVVKQGYCFAVANGNKQTSA